MQSLRIISIFMFVCTFICLFVCLFASCTFMHSYNCCLHTLFCVSWDYFDPFGWIWLLHYFLVSLHCQPVFNFSPIPLRIESWLMLVLMVQPVDRISIEAMDDIDQLAVPGGEGSWVGERQGGRQAWKQARLQQYLKSCIALLVFWLLPVWWEQSEPWQVICCPG